MLRENWEMQQQKVPLRPNSELCGLHSFQHPTITQITSVSEDWVLLFSR